MARELSYVRSMRAKDDARKRFDPKDIGKVPTVSRVLPDGTIVELLYNGEENSTAFAVWDGRSLSVAPNVKTATERLVPFSPYNNLIRTRAVLLPSQPQEFVSVLQLVEEVTAFIHRYADFSAVFEAIAANYVLLTWVYDAFNEVPYLRLRGDFGTGKTRALLTIGSICNKPFFASGASTVSPLFHTLNAFRGTLVLDEADFRFSDEKAELVKILNNGNVRGLPVLRTILSRDKEFNPQAFQVFGPKIVATRSGFEDRGLESRFLTEQMGGRALRSDIPLSTPDCFFEEARSLRNKLLMFRFQQLGATRINPSLIDSTLEPRLNQVLLPLLSLVEDRELRIQIRNFASDDQAVLDAERGNSFEGHVLEALNTLLHHPQGTSIGLKEIARAVADHFGDEFQGPVTSRQVGAILRRRLNIRVYKSHGLYVVPIGERRKIKLLAKRYGIGVSQEDDIKVQFGDMGSTGTSRSAI